MKTDRATKATSKAAAAKNDAPIFKGVDANWTERYVLCDQLVDPPTARPRQRFEAIAKLIRDLLASRWIKTRQTRERENPKRVYYLSMEFLMGRALTNNIINLMAEPIVHKALK